MTWLGAYKNCVTKAERAFGFRMDNIDIGCDHVSKNCLNSGISLLLRTWYHNLMYFQHMLWALFWFGGF